MQQYFDTSKWSKSVVTTHSWKVRSAVATGPKRIVANVECCEMNGFAINNWPRWLPGRFLLCAVDIYIHSCLLACCYCFVANPTTLEFPNKVASIFQILVFFPF